VIASGPFVLLLCAFSAHSASRCYLSCANWNAPILSATPISSGTCLTQPGQHHRRNARLPIVAADQRSTETRPRSNGHIETVSASPRALRNLPRSHSVQWSCRRKSDSCYHHSLRPSPVPQSRYEPVSVLQRRRVTSVRQTRQGAMVVPKTKVDMARRLSEFHGVDFHALNSVGIGEHCSGSSSPSLTHTSAKLTRGADVSFRSGRRVWTSVMGHLER